MDARVTEFPVAEAKARFSELLDRAEKGESLTIRRHGKPVARLVPAQGEALTVEERRERRLAWEARRDAADGPRLGPDLTVQDLIDAGRMRAAVRRLVTSSDSLWNDFFDAPGIDLGAREQPPAQERDFL